MNVMWWIRTLAAALAGWVVGFVATLVILFSQPGATLDLAWSLGISDQMLSLILLGGAALGTSASVGLLRGIRAALASLVTTGAVSLAIELASSLDGFVLPLFPGLFLIAGSAAVAARGFPRPGPHLARSGRE